MNILLLTKRYYTNQDLFERPFGRLHYLPHYWSQNHQVSVIAFDYHSSRNNICNNRLYTLYSIGMRSPHTILSPLRSILPFQRFSPDIIIASGDIILGILGNRLARKIGVPFLFDIYDDYREFPLNRLSGFHLLFKSVCKKSTAIACASPALASIASAWNSSTFVAPNGYDSEIFSPEKEYPEEEFITKEYTYQAAYTGTIDFRFDTNLVIEVFEELNKNSNFIRLTHMGSGGEELRPYSWYRHFGNCEQSKVAKLISSSNLGIATYSNHPLVKSCNPCKAIEYLAMRKILVGSRISSLIEFENHGIRLFDSGNTQQFKLTLLSSLEEQSVITLPKGLDWKEVSNSYLKQIESCVTM